MNVSLGIRPFRQPLPTVGLRVRGLQAGPAEAPPVLLLHGWPEWSRAWRPLMERLPPRWRLLAPDLRGFGDTEPPARAPSTDAGPQRHAQDLLALADAMGVERFALVSHDVGSFVAQALARQAPQRVAGLFFFNCAHPGIGARWVEPGHLGEVWYPFFQQLPWAAAMVGSSTQACRLYLDHFLSHWSHRRDWVAPVLGEWVRQFMKPGRLQGGFNWYASVHAQRMAVVRGDPPPPPIGLPTQVLWGAHDPVLKAAWTDRLGDHFTDLRLAQHPQAGHFVHLEQPDDAAAAVGGFLDRLVW